METNVSRLPGQDWCHAWGICQEGLLLLLLLAAVVTASAGSLDEHVALAADHCATSADRQHMASGMAFVYVWCMGGLPYSTLHSNTDAVAVHSRSIFVLYA
jgi:hypothetical protein